MAGSCSTWSARSSGAPEGPIGSTVLTSPQIKARALDLGFELCGIAGVGEFDELGHLPSWLARGYAGRMSYLNRTARLRADVRRWLPSARSVIVVGCLYNTNRPYSTEVADPDVALVARFAWGEDYHRVITDRLQRLLDWMRGEADEAFEWKVGVDTGPVQERAYARRAGIGWIGKNTCVINPALGSWILLGELVTSLALEADAPALDQCGTCQLCVEACPTHALVEPWVLDARRCISYLTIELKPGFAPDQAAAIGSHVFGCDICQEVCPHNAAAPETSRLEWQPRPLLDRQSLTALDAAPDEVVGAAIDGTTLARTGIERLRRNIRAARSR